MSLALETYDPNWEARWQAAYDACQEIERADARDGDNLAVLGANMAISERRLTEMRRAWDAQFKTVADFAEFLSKQLDIAMSTTDKFVPWPVFPDNATREDVMAAWVIADRELKRLKGFDLSQ